jgi:hypothetical protein
VRRRTDRADADLAGRRLGRERDKGLRFGHVFVAWLGNQDLPYRLTLDSKPILVSLIQRGATRSVHNDGPEPDQDERSSNECPSIWAGRGIPIAPYRSLSREPARGL